MSKHTVKQQHTAIRTILDALRPLDREEQHRALRMACWACNIEPGRLKHVAKETRTRPRGHTAFRCTQCALETVPDHNDGYGGSCPGCGLGALLPVYPPRPEERYMTERELELRDSRRGRTKRNLGKGTL